MCRNSCRLKRVGGKLPLREKTRFAMPVLVPCEGCHQLSRIYRFTAGGLKASQVVYKLCGQCVIREAAARGAQVSENAADLASAVDC